MDRGYKRRIVLLDRSRVVESVDCYTLLEASIPMEGRIGSSGVLSTVNMRSTCSYHCEQLSSSLGQERKEEEEGTQFGISNGSQTILFILIFMYIFPDPPLR